MTYFFTLSKATAFREVAFTGGVATMDSSSIVIWSQVAEGAGSLASVLISGLIAIFVYKYTRNKDRLDFLLNRWSSQQEININQLNDDRNLEAFEKIVYGDSFKTSITEARKRFHLFLIINGVQNNFFALNEGIISEGEFDSMSIPTLKLIVNQKQEVLYLLRERGYTDEFRAKVLNLLDRVTPPVPPSRPSAYHPDQTSLGDRGGSRA